jgi:CO/xanthine dehydrogenase FAD-binding subunit
MTVKRFDYLVPDSLHEAVTMLSQRPETTILAGGTNVLVQLKEKHREASALLSLRRIPELHQLQQGDGLLHIGAAVTMGQLADAPVVRRDFTALAEAAVLIGSVQTRNMATVGGNLCNASPSADTAPPLLVLGAQAVLFGPQGERRLAMDNFFSGPGQTALRPGELLKEIAVPAPAASSGSAYVRHIPRGAMDISVVGAAAALTLDETGQIAGARIALGAVAPTPILAPQAAALLIGKMPDEALWREAGSLAAQEADPQDDVRASIAFRRHLVEVLVQEALRAALGRAANHKEGEQRD